MAKNEDNNISGLNQDLRGIKNEKFINISIPSSTHQKLQRICILIREGAKPKMGLVAGNIIENFIDENREELNKIQSQKIRTF